MHQTTSKTTSSPGLLPWQGALMVVWVTAAGLFHEHPAAVRPLLAGLQTVMLHTGAAHGVHPAALLPAALPSVR